MTFCVTAQWHVAEGAKLFPPFLYCVNEGTFRGCADVINVGNDSPPDPWGIKLCSFYVATIIKVILRHTGDTALAFQHWNLIKHVWFTFLKNTASEGTSVMKGNIGNVQQSFKIWISEALEGAFPHRRVSSWFTDRAIKDDFHWKPLCSACALWKVDASRYYLESLFICYHLAKYLAASSRVGLSRRFQRNPTFSAELTEPWLFFSVVLRVEGVMGKMPASLKSDKMYKNKQSCAEDRVLTVLWQLSSGQYSSFHPWLAEQKFRCVSHRLYSIL